MDPFSFPPLAALLDATHSLLLALSDLLTPLAGASATAAAIVLVTILVRVALVPVGISQARAEQARARLAPKLRELQRRHARDRERLQRETMKLYADENASPLAGCMPMLLQAPAIGIVYAVFAYPSIAGHANELLAGELAGVPLGTSFIALAGSGALDPAGMIVFGAIAGVMVVVAEVSRRVFRPMSDETSPLATPSAVRMLGALQFATAVFALFVPLAAALYLVVTVTWTLGQRVLLRRRFPLLPK